MHFPKTFQKCLFNQWSVNSPSKYCSLIFGHISRTHVAPSLPEFCEYEHPVWRWRGGPPTLSAVGGFDTLQRISRVIAIHSNGSVLFFTAMADWAQERGFYYGFQNLIGFSYSVQFNSISFIYRQIIVALGRAPIWLRKCLEAALFPSIFVPASFLPY